MHRPWKCLKRYWLKAGAKMKKTVLITGASGFLGNYVMQRLSKEPDWEIHAAANTRKVAGAICHQVNLLDNEAVSRLMAKVRPSYLMHFAWETRPQIYLQSPTNLDWLAAGIHLLQEFKRCGGIRFISAGTCNEYDMSQGLLREESIFEDKSSLYGLAKRSFHNIARQYCENEGLSYASGRIFFMYGDGDKQNRAVPYAINGLLKGEAIACNAANAYRDYMYVADGAEAFTALLKSDFTGAMNIATGQPVSMGEIFTEIAYQLKREDLLSLNAQVSGPNTILADVGKMHRELNFEPRFSLSEGLARTISWQKELLK